MYPKGNTGMDTPEFWLPVMFLLFYRNNNTSYNTNINISALLAKNHYQHRLSMV